MVYRRLNVPDSDPFMDLDQIYEPTIQKASATSILVNISMIGVVGTPTTYIVKYQKMTNYTTTDGAVQTQTSASNGITVSGLTTGSLYKIITQLQNASGYGKTMEVFYQLSASEEVPAKSGSSKNVGDKVSASSFLTITVPERTSDTAKKNKYSFAYSNFDSIQLGTYVNSTVGLDKFERPSRSYSPGYYSFGTSIVFDPLLQYKAQGAGIGFFLNSSNDAGYFVTIETTATAAASKTSPVKIFKLESKQIKKLADSQQGNRATLDELLAGKTYYIDVKVKIEGFSVKITAYINGFKIEATDTTTGSSNNQILYPTTKVALLGVQGTSKFDYVYADTIDINKYNSDYLDLNLYNGQLADDFLDASYGDLLYNFSNEGLDSTKKPKTFEEFGTVVRELRKEKIIFGNPPSIPVKWTTGANRLTKILAETKDNFKSEVLVLNNSSISVPLSDRGVNQLSIFGYDIGFSGDIEYTTSPAAEYSNTEPVIFQSSWLQNQKDVKSLAEWIKGRVVNKAKIVTMTVFGNPLISVGDIITVNYPYQGFTTSQKIIIVKVSQRFERGLETQIVGRTL
jgi:hypothetical protein